MQRFIHVLAVVALLLCSARVLAKAAHLPLPQKVSASNLIARIEVLSIAKNPMKPVTREMPHGYRSIAKIRVIGAIKGAPKGRVFDLEFDNGLACPNILYAKGDDCLIFARRLANGRYETYNKFDVRKNKMDWWPEGKQHSTSYREVVVQIKNLMKQARPAT